jgi:hypothetical protein
LEGNNDALTFWIIDPHNFWIVKHAALSAEWVIVKVRAEEGKGVEGCPVELWAIPLQE